MTTRQHPRSRETGAQPGANRAGCSGGDAGSTDEICARIESALGEAALLRVPTGRRDWAQDLPPAPPGQRVSVSFGRTPSDAPTDGQRRALDALGYVVVASHEGGQSADFLVPLTLAEAHPVWWRAMTEQAAQLFRLSMGPVARSLHDVLGPHAPGG
jgi:hypothetical protein